MSTYTQDITHLIGKINTNLPDNDTQAITAARIRDAMGAVAYNYDLYVLKTDLDTAGYVTASQLEGLATEQELQDGMQTVHDDAYAYVVEKINELPIVDLSSYVTKTELSAMGYVTESSLGDYVTETELSSMGYITENDLPDMSTYATKAYVADYVAEHAPMPDLSAYVTKTELSQASYVTQNELSNMGYVTQSQLSANSYATTSQLSAKQDTLVSGTNIKTINNESLLGSGNIDIQGGGSSIAAVTQAEYDAMEQAGTLDPDTLYVISDAQSADLDDYVTKTELSAAGYLTAVPSEYITETELSGMGYITSSALGDYVTKTELSSAGYLTSIPAEYVTQSQLSANSYVTATELSNVLSTASYVTQNELSQMGYITNSDLSQASYVTQQALSAMGYITSSYAETYYVEYASFGDYTSEMQDTLIDANILITDPETGDWTTQAMASETYVAEYVASYAPTPDLSAYVTKTELSAAGYLTTVPSEYVTESEITSMGYITGTELSAMGYITSSDIPAIPVIDENLIPNTTLTYTLGDSTHFYDATYTNRVNGPSEGMAFRLGDTGKVALYSAAFRPASNNTMSLGTASQQWTYTYSYNFIENGTNISDKYATKTELTSKQDTLVSGTNIKTINNESLLGSGNIDIQSGAEPDYSRVLTFTAEQANSTIKLQRVGSSSSLTNVTLQYSTDGGETWTNYTLGQSKTLSTIGNTIKFKGTNTTLGYDYNNYHQFVMTGKIKASGDVTSLINEVGGEASLNNYCFLYLFNNCSALSTAPYFQILL